MPRPFYYRVGHGIARREGTKAVIASAPTRDNTVHVAIIVGSTRPGRQADSVARWVHGLAAGRDRASFEVVDIADFELPLLDEDLPPMAAQYARPHTHRWAATIARFDAFVLVTPEYNHSPAAALKNALDFLYAEWNDKAVAFVSYGIDGGIRALWSICARSPASSSSPTSAPRCRSASQPTSRDTPSSNPPKGETARSPECSTTCCAGAVRSRACEPRQRGREMPTVVIRYQLHPDQVEEQLRLLDDVYREMHAVRPRDLSYTTIQLDDDVSFLAIVSGDAGPAVLTGLPVFQHYRTTLDQRCIHPPVMTSGRTIHTYDAHLANSAEATP